MTYHEYALILVFTILRLFYTRIVGATALARSEEPFTFTAPSVYQ
ncbi:MAG: hypothetical protein OXF41_04715 [bacterium]|nr:hypothetical protein [bacterium]